jgi:DNA-binding CsgD family transcriptional regulator
MDPHASAGEKGGDDIFTDKQRRVLDLLIEHKTSKEIARSLGISPFTVDQRISLARAKLGVSSRNELAARYRAMRQAPSHPSADIFTLSEGEHSEAVDESEADGTPSVVRSRDPIPYQARQRDDLLMSAVPNQDKIPCPTAGDLDYRVGPEVFEGSSGGLWRFGAIVATALLLVVTILGLFAIFNQLNDMLS